MTIYHVFVSPPPNPREGTETQDAISSQKKRPRVRPPKILARERKPNRQGTIYAKSTLLAPLNPREGTETEVLWALLQFLVLIVSPLHILVRVRKHVIV